MGNQSAHAGQRLPRVRIFWSVRPLGQEDEGKPTRDKVWPVNDTAEVTLPCVCCCPQADVRHPGAVGL
jgi:hypothetical protein